MSADTSLPRLLRGVSVGRSMSLREHVALHGEMPDVADDGSLVETVERAGLRGRGGGGFPAGTKLRAVRESGRPAVVVANGAEGEPASAKDRVLVASAPHLVLDGALLAARAVGAQEVHLCLPEQARAAWRSASNAIDERRGEGRRQARITLRALPDRFLAGEESALVSYLNGGPLKPTLVPPRPFERGVGRRPTLVSNVETLAHMALIARHGDRWFRACGTRAEPGSALVTLDGAVARPGVYEIAVGTRLADLLDAAGGATEDVGAVLSGGYFGSWIPGSELTAIQLDNASLSHLGAGLGAGTIYLLPASACGVAETARIIGYLARESAGQCGPCVHGLASIAEAFSRLAGASGGEDAARIARWCAQVRGRGACHHPDGAVRLTTSAMATFAPEIRRHVDEGVCSRRRDVGLLPIPDLQGEKARVA